MSNEAQEYDIATIRQLLLAAFTPEDLRRFCYDRPTFRPVVNRFGRPYRLDDMADELIIYSDKYCYLDELLAELAQHNPRQYARFIEPELSQDQPSSPISQILTISSPISLLLVRVPAGEFQMGSVTARDKLARDNEFPPHTVHVPEFHIGKYPVTNIQYQAFVRATGHRTPAHWEEGIVPSDKANHPVLTISSKDALAFCDWLSRETKHPFRLPTEAEWEKAARDTDGRIYPWGDDPPDERRCNFNSNVGDTTTIGRYSPQGDSPYGCTDMAGNVWEWCQSPYRPYPYPTDDGREDQQEQDSRVLRGGACWSKPQDVRCAARDFNSPDIRLIDSGFRVAARQD
jgi:formylglycine-generating enzyme required for sulfatase activity